MFVALGVSLVASGTAHSAPLSAMWAGGGMPTRRLVCAMRHALLSCFVVAFLFILFVFLVFFDMLKIVNSLFVVLCWLTFVIIIHLIFDL